MILQGRPSFCEVLHIQNTLALPTANTNGRLTPTSASEGMVLPPQEEKLVP